MQLTNRGGSDLSLDQQREGGKKGAVLLDLKSLRWRIRLERSEWRIRLDRRHPCLQRRVFQRRPTYQVSDRAGLFVLRTHAGKDACGPVRLTLPSTNEMTTTLKTLAQLAAIFAAAYALKSFYSTATVNDLRWILAPTTFLVELISGERFTFESLAGYMNGDHTFLIAASCSGVNFLMISFLVLTLGKLWREREMSWTFFPIAALAAYATTLIANTVRIVIALQMHANSFQLGGFDAEELHRIEGIVVYFLFLLLLFIASEKLAADKMAIKSFASGLVRRSAYLLLIYYAVTLGIPIVRGSYREAEFWEHAGFVTVVPLLFIIPIWIYSARSRIHEET